MIVKLTYIFTEDSEKTNKSTMKKIKITHNLLPWDNIRILIKLIN